MRVKRYAIVLAVAAGAGVAKLAVIRLDTGETGWWEATGSVIDAVLTGVMLVAALEWVDRRRWQPANRAGLVSFARTVHLAASGWSAPEGLPPPDLRSGSLRTELQTQSRKLRDQATRLTESASDIAKTDNENLQTIMMYAAARAAAEYWAEGSRSRRLAALARLDDIALPRLLSRDRDPLVEGLFSQLNLKVTTALACAHHADSVIRERMLPPWLAGGHRSPQSYRHGPRSSESASRRHGPGDGLRAAGPAAARDSGRAGRAAAGPST